MLPSDLYDACLNVQCDVPVTNTLFIDQLQSTRHRATRHLQKKGEGGNGVIE